MRRSKTKRSAAEVARLGVQLAAQELERRGAGVARATSGRSRNTLRATLPPRGGVEIYVKTRSAGTWQTDIRKGSPAPQSPADDRFWIFVDLTNAPTFYIAPAWWVENDIYETYHADLARHGGRRPRTPASTHHGIAEHRINQWRERWDLLSLGQ
jgi:hypothetical protein